MIAAGLESVLIGNPSGFEENTFGRGERVLSSGRVSSVVAGNLFLVAALFYFDAVRCFVTTMATRGHTNVTRWRLIIYRIIVGNYLNA